MPRLRSLERDSRIVQLATRWCGFGQVYGNLKQIEWVPPDDGHECARAARQQDASARGAAETTEKQLATSADCGGDDNSSQRYQPVTLSAQPPPGAIDVTLPIVNDDDRLTKKKSLTPQMTVCSFFEEESKLMRPAATQGNAGGWVRWSHAFLGKACGCTTPSEMQPHPLSLQ